MTEHSDLESTPLSDPAFDPLFTTPQDVDPEEEETEWDGKFSRANLEPERLYYEQPSGMYFFTPDGVGCIWYETREQAMEDTNAFGQPIITLAQELRDY